jgi:hypothetical protein
MLDLADFVTERGGDIKKIKESQQKRFAPEEAVDEVVALYEEARRGMDPFLIRHIGDWSSEVLGNPRGRGVTQIVEG